MEKSFSDQEIYERDIEWLKESDVLVAEVSTPSLGVGYEISYAVQNNKDVLCLYREGSEKELSAMINGCSDLTVASYSKFGDVKEIIEKYMS